MTYPPDEPFGEEIVRGMHQSRLDFARSLYETSINRLWAGCGGGLIAIVSILRHTNDIFFWLSVASFGLAILLLAFGVVATLVSERAVIRHLEDIDGILKMRTDYAKRPSDEAGLNLWHPRTWTALSAAALFIVGVVFSAVLLWRH